MRKTFITLGATAAFALGVSEVPIVPTPMEWAVSYETLAFETADGDLDIDQYAFDPATGNYYIRLIPKEEGNFAFYNFITPLDKPHPLTEEDILIRKKVEIRCEKCASYSEFVSRDGKRHRVAYDHTDFKLKKYDTIRPSKQELSTIVETVGDIMAPEIVFAAYGKVQSALDVSGSSVTSLAEPFGSDTTSGNVVVVGAGYNGSTATDITGISDSQTNTYTRIDGSTESSFVAGEVWYAYNITGGTNTVTVTKTTTSDLGIAIVEYSGLTTSDPFDLSESTACATGCATTDYSSGSTLTTNQDEELVFGFATCNAGLNRFDVGTGFGNYEEAVNGTTGIEIAIEDLRQTSASTQAALFDVNNAETNRSATVATFFEALAGASPTPTEALMFGF